jgi:pantothenate kinase type III
MVVKNEAEKIIFSTVVPEVETLVKKFIQDKEEIAKLVASKSKELLAGTLKS